MQDQVSKSQFKAKALELFRQIESSGDPVIVTDHGVPTIEVRQYRKTERSPLEVLKGSVTEYSEPTDPVAEGEWQVLGDYRPSRPDDPSTGALSVCTTCNR